jgi:hypothetical protein
VGWGGRGFHEVETQKRAQRGTREARAEAPASSAATLGPARRRADGILPRGRALPATADLRLEAQLVNDIVNE